MQNYRLFPYPSCSKQEMVRPTMHHKEMKKYINYNFTCERYLFDSKNARNYTPFQKTSGGDTPHFRLMLWSIGSCQNNSFISAGAIYLRDAIVMLYLLRFTLRLHTSFQSPWSCNLWMVCLSFWSLLLPYLSHLRQLSFRTQYATVGCLKISLSNSNYANH